MTSFTALVPPNPAPIKFFQPRSIRKPKKHYFKNKRERVLETEPGRHQFNAPRLALLSCVAILAAARLSAMPWYSPRNASRSLTTSCLRSSISRRVFSLSSIICKARYRGCIHVYRQGTRGKRRRYTDMRGMWKGGGRRRRGMEQRCFCHCLSVCNGYCIR